MSYRSGKMGFQCHETIKVTGRSGTSSLPRAHKKRVQEGSLRVFQPNDPRQWIDVCRWKRLSTIHSLQSADLCTPHPCVTRDDSWTLAIGKGFWIGYVLRFATKTCASRSMLSKKW